jgi:putative ABC transport system permease protein
VDTAFQDLRFGLRTLRTRPVFAVIAVATLGLGIGSATTMFSVVETVIIDAVPFGGTARLVDVWQVAKGAQGAPELVGQTWDRLPLSFQQYRDWQAGNTAFESIAVHNAIQATLMTDDGADRVQIGFRSASLLSVLGVRPVMGRWFTAEDEGWKPAEGAAPVVVISHEMWRTRLGGDPGVLGRSVTINGRSSTIIGVLPSGFSLRHLGMHWQGADRDGKRDVWAPIGAPGLGNGQNLEAIARLAPGVPEERALAEATEIFRASQSSAQVRLADRATEETQGFSGGLLLLLAASSVLLLIACANVAALSLGELVARRRELSTRAALGAWTGRVVRQLLTEMLALGSLGSLVGVGLAFTGTRLMVAMGPPLPRAGAIHVDLRVLAFAAAAGVLAAAAAGTLPAVVGARGSLAAMTAAARTTSRSRGRVERAIVTLQVAMTVVLLVVGGLLARSLTRLLAVDPGFNAVGLASVRIALPEDRLRTPEIAGGIYREILSRLQALPGVTAASASTRLPFPGETNTSTAFFVDGNGDRRQFSAPQENVLPGYHETLGIPLREGRTFTDADSASGQPVVIVCENLARRYWPDRSPVGETLRWNGREVTIVGVAGDVKRNNLAAVSDPVIWSPLLQQRGPDLRLVARTGGDPAGLLPAMRAAVHAVDRRIPVTEASTMPDLIRLSATEERYRTSLMVVFGALGCLLAAVGVFGVSARAVALRGREFGIRLALGADHRRLMRSAIGENVRMGAVGLAFGLVAALPAARSAGAFLFGVMAWDPATYVVVALLVMATIAAASLVPIWRIALVAPADVLKDE